MKIILSPAKMMNINLNTLLIEKNYEKQKNPYW